MQKLNENSIEFFLSTQTRSRFKSSQLESYIEETKCIGKALKALCLVLDSIVDLFPINT